MPFGDIYFHFFYFFRFSHSMPLFASNLRITISQLNIQSSVIIWYLTWFICRHNMDSPELKFLLHEKMKHLIKCGLGICSPALDWKLGLRTIWGVCFCSYFHSSDWGSFWGGLIVNARALQEDEWARTFKTKSKNFNLKKSN